MYQPISITIPYWLRHKVQVSMSRYIERLYQESLQDLQVEMWFNLGRSLRYYLQHKSFQEKLPIQRLLRFNYKETSSAQMSNLASSPCSASIYKSRRSVSKSQRHRSPHAKSTVEENSSFSVRCEHAVFVANLREVFNRHLPVAERVEAVELMTQRIEKQGPHYADTTFVLVLCPEGSEIYDTLVFV